MDLYIDGTRADISRNSFAVNWKWYEITSPTKRYTVSSTNMTLPFSPINNSIIEFANISGSDLTPIWNELESKIYFGNYLALTGSLKVKNIDITRKTINTSIRGDNNVISLLNSNTPREIMNADAVANLPASWATLALAISGLSTNGWLLPVVDDGSNLLPSGPARIKYDITYNDFRHHEIWITLDNFIQTAFTNAGVTLEIFEAGATSTYASSTLRTSWINMLLPATHAGLKPAPGTAVNLTLTDDRYFNLGTEKILNADILVCGGLDTWDVFKIVCQYFNMGIYIDQIESKVTIFDLNTTATVTKDWSDKLISHKKNPVIKGYEKTNYVRFNTSDNLDSDYGQIEIANNSNITYLKESKVLGTVSIGVPGIYDYFGTTAVLVESDIFRFAYFNDKAAYNSVVLLNKTPITTNALDVNMTSAFGNRTVLTTLYKMSLLDTTSYFDWIESKALDINELYDCEISISLHDLIDLKPWDLIRVKQLGEEMYINQIKGFNLNKPARIELVKLG